VGFFLFKRLLQEPKGRNVLSAKKKEFNLIGVYVHNEANIFNHKKSFMQDLHDLLEREVKYDKLRTGGTYSSGR
jgi:hypothetical protein